MSIVPKKDRKKSKFYSKAMYFCFYLAIVCVLIPALPEIIGLNLSYWFKFPFGIIGVLSIASVFYFWIKYVGLGVKYGSDLLREPNEKEERDYKLKGLLNDN